MSRPIKVRAWDINPETQAGRFIYIDLTSGLLDTDALWLLNNCDFYEFTGLHDATKWQQLSPEERDAWVGRGEAEATWHGREIYEGDLLAAPLVRALVVFRQGGFFIKDCTGYVPSAIKHQLLYSKVDNLEVIGNIYQNPELIGGAS